MIDGDAEPISIPCPRYHRPDHGPLVAGDESATVAMTTDSLSNGFRAARLGDEIAGNFASIPRVSAANWVVLRRGTETLGWRHFPRSGATSDDPCSYRKNPQRYNRI